jgi:hypothetical protein
VEEVLVVLIGVSLDVSCNAIYRQIVEERIHVGDRLPATVF